MTKNNAHEQAPPQPDKPNPALKRLEKLVGTWDIKGRTLDSKEDNITGRMTCEWLPGGFFLTQRGEASCGGLTVRSLEIIRYDPATDTFPASVYSNGSGTVLPYHWDVRGDTVTHWTETDKYTGTLSEDGRTLTGGWRPIAGRGSLAFDAVMTRVD
jgi:hypothetical protein